MSIGKWQGRLDSNQRMAGSKPAALPLGDAPVSVASNAWHSVPLEQTLQLAMQHRNVASFGYKPCKGLCKKGRDFISFSFAWEAPKHTTSSSSQFCFGKFT